MDEREEKYAKIKEFLQERYPKGESISTIARNLNMNRGSVAKYMEVLHSHGHVIMKPYGKAKLYYFSRNIAFDDLFDYLSDAIVILDTSLHISMVNKSFIDTFNIRSGKNIVGRELSKINLAVFDNPTIWENINRALNSQIFVNEMLLIEHGTDRIFLTEFVSTFISSISFAGKPGIMISLRDITVWKKTEEALKDSERKIRTLFEEVPSGIILFQEDGTILNANRASFEILGITEFADLADFRLYDLFCSENIIKGLISRNEIAEITLSCDFDRMKFKVLKSTKKSGTAYFQIVFAPVVNKGSNTPKEYFILFLDITAKKIAEKQLKERYRSIVGNLPGIVFQFYARDSGEWGVYYVNERSRELYGLPTEPLENWFDRFGDCIDLRDRQRWYQSIIKVIETVSPWEFEGKFIRPSGEEMYIRGISKPVRMKNETVWNGIFLDITDRRKAEEALHISEERLRGITSNLPGIVYQFYATDSGEYGTYYVDNRSYEIYGVYPAPVDTWIERYAECIAPEDKERWFKSIDDVTKRGVSWEFEGRFIRPDGEEMYIQVLSKPVRLKHETVWNGIILNVTARKKAEEALRRTELKEARYHSFFENTCNGVLIYEPVGNCKEYIIKDVNKVTASLLRMNKEDIVGKKLFEEFPDLPRDYIHNLLRRVMVTEVPEFVMPVKYRNHEDFPWISHYVFKLPSGEIASFMIDVTKAVDENKREKN
ncbi:PAS domain S-box-containing protein [Methanomicrobium sp. W14]|uniref:PAS domain S-box protein n=1 Tax=Methanomicrobium sp. W14 TaxID=2817839 RepID=UPI001AEB3E32|nr:PAS domain S-box protein [Methanomicrobium sp. W14]MBP2133738.1 PAS domain S-box-containing protein [Methanomicrobium sp. W14]